MKQLLLLHVEKLAAWWCKLQHASLLWPSHGQYTCAVCGRHYPVPWQRPAANVAISASLLASPMPAQTGSRGGIAEDGPAMPVYIRTRPQNNFVVGVTRNFARIGSDVCG